MSGCCNDDAIITSQKGEDGAQGYAGWSPLFSVVTDGSRRVLRLVGWTGGAGSTPGFIGQYLGASEIVSDISDAVDIRGATGATGSTGNDGNDGWSPVLAVVSDSERRVLQIVDWQGGEGTKPSTTNQFIGASGIVSSAAAAVDIRGPQGEQGDPGDDSGVPDPTGEDGKFLTVSSDEYVLQTINQVPTVTNNTRRILREKHDGSGSEWYTTFNSFVRIPMQANGIFSSTTSYVTLRNSDSTVFLKATLPNDGTIRNFSISASLSLSSNAPSEGSNAIGKFAIRNTTSGTTITEEAIETAYRKYPTFNYEGQFTCSGQEIALQFKHDVGQNSSGFLGGTFSIKEIV